MDKPNTLRDRVAEKLSGINPEGTYKYISPSQVDKLANQILSTIYSSLEEALDELPLHNIPNRPLRLFSERDVKDKLERILK